MKNLLQLKSIIIFYIILITSLFFTFKYHVNHFTLELASSVHHSENDNFKAGNILHATSKIQRYIQFSDMLSGVRVIDRSNMRTLVNYGDTSKMNTLKKVLLFNNEYTAKVNKNLSATYYIRPKYALLYFILLSSSLSIFLVFAFKVNTNQTQKYYIEQLKMEKEKYSFVKQVAHDIRSPLAALSMAMKEIKMVDEENRSIVNSAINRIQDIANNLLFNVPNAKITKVEPKLLSSVIASITTEKRTEYRSSSNIEISFPIKEESYGAFSKIDSSEFKRIISNLINNSIEAFGESKGEILIQLKKEDELIKVIIQDTGPGIPKSLINEVTQEGYSKGKKKGSGLGLFHAKKTLESWGGSLEIKSEENIGTSITLVMQPTKAPQTFVPILKLYSDKKIMILDDDESIHHTWDSRLKSCGIDLKNIEHFYTLDKFKEFHLNHKVQDYIILSDFEFIGDKKTGMDLIEELNLSKQTYLVTSHYEESELIARAKKQRIGLIDKGMSGFIPIEVSESKIVNKKSIALIDDDKLIRLAWSRSAKKQNLNFHSFANSHEFKDAQLPIDTKIYVDIQLEEENGLDLSKELYLLGYKDLYLATGYNSQDIEKPNYINDITGKVAPF